MLTLGELRGNFKERIIEIARLHKAENVRVFGSIVHGRNHAGSDIDLLVHPQKDASLLDLCAIQNKLSDMLETRVDVVADDELRPELAPFILKEAVPL